MKSNVLFPFALVAVLATPLESDKIMIKSSSVHGGTRLFQAELAGKSVELECFTKEKSCTDLTPGDYSMLRVKDGGIYQDCENVNIYKQSGTRTKDTALGEYCLLQP